MHEAGETNLHSMKSHVTIKHSSISMPNKSLPLEKSLMEAAILIGKQNIRYKM